MTSTHPTRLADFWLPILEQARRSFAAPPADTAEVGRSLVAALDAAAARAAEHGHSQDQIQQALFAVVAWIDEAAMTRPWPGASAWRLAPLQRHYFSTTRAGVEFFQRLQALPDDATSVREVYGLMLVAGFAGHYTIKPPGELAAVPHVDMRVLDPVQHQRRHGYGRQHIANIERGSRPGVGEGRRGAGRQALEAPPPFGKGAVAGPPRREPHERGPATPGRLGRVAGSAQPS